MDETEALRSKITALEADLEEARRKAPPATPKPADSPAGATARQVEVLQEELRELRAELKALKAPAPPAPPPTNPPSLPNYRGALKDR